jgi:RNA polymerase sigma-70 factor (ECF subfamily)
MPTTANSANWIGDALARFEGPLLRYAARLTGSLEQARDVVQETFLRLCQAERQRVDGHLAEWLYTVCRNRAYDLHRQSRRQVPMTEELLLWHPAPGPGPDEQAARRDAMAAAWRLLETLPPRQQEVVRLRFQGGLSYAEISRVTGASVGHVGLLLHQAVAALRKELQAAPTSATLRGDDHDAH